jgi:hypothetical protein
MYSTQEKKKKKKEEEECRANRQRGCGKSNPLSFLVMMGVFLFLFSLPDIFRVVESQKLMCGRIFVNGQITKDRDNC